MAPRPSRPLLAAAVVTLALLASAPSQAAQFIGPPDGQLRITAQNDSRLQAKQLLNPAFVFYPDTSAAGNSGFYIGSPVAQGILEQDDRFGVTFPFGPSITNPWVAVSEGPVTGTGTQADPFTQVMVYKGREPVDGNPPVDQVIVTQTIRYIAGNTYFDVQYDVKNVSGEPLRFRASTGADLHGGNDFGFGSFTAGPPRTVLGHNQSNGYIGGLVEQTPPWTNYQEGSYRTAIFDPIQVPSGAGYTDAVNAQLVDYGIGAEWDNHYAAGAGLAHNATATYNARWTFSFNPPGSPAPGPVPGTGGNVATPNPTGTGTGTPANPFTASDLSFSQESLRLLFVTVTQNTPRTVLQQRGFGLFFPNGRPGFLALGLDTSATGLGIRNATASAKRKRRKRRAKRVTVAAGSHRFTGTGGAQVRIPLTRKGRAVLRRALRRGKGVRLRMRVSFTPTGGRKITQTRNATLKPSKRKSKRKRR